MKHLLEERGGGLVNLHPVGVVQEVVRVVRDYNLLERDASLFKSLDQVNHLAEANVAVVVALNQQHGRFPGVDESDGRRLPCEVKCLLSVRRFLVAWFEKSAPAINGPIVHAVNVNA